MALAIGFRQEGEPLPDQPGGGRKCHDDISPPVSGQVVIQVLSPHAWMAAEASAEQIQTPAPT